MKHQSEAEWQRHLDERNQSVKLQIEDAISRIEKLAQSVDSINLFVTLVAMMSLGPAKYGGEADFRSTPARIELLAFHLFPFFGVVDRGEITPWHIKECIDALEKLFAHRTFLGFTPENEEQRRNPVDQIIREVRQHTRIVRGSAYPEQTVDEIVAIQGKFESWFVRKVGIGPKRAQDILWNIVLTHEKKASDFTAGLREYAKDLETYWKISKRHARKKSSSQMSEAEKLLLATFKDEWTAWAFGYLDGLSTVAPPKLPVSPNDLINVTPPPTQEEWEALINLIGLTTTNRAHMTDPVEVRWKPLYVLPDNRVVLIDISNALDVLWDEFEQIAKSDHSFFHDRYQKRRAEWLEEEVTKHFSKIFSPKFIYTDLTYPDPDKENSVGATAQLDIAIKWGPFLLLIEAKAKQFRLEAQLGDVGRLRTDIKENIEDAFEQGRRAIRYIDKVDPAVFVEAGSGRTLTINRKEFHRIYILTISQHHLAGLATRLATLQNLGLFKDSEYPFSISVADLAMVLEFCDGPDVFLHYIEKRLALQKSSENILADELRFFGAYLDTRLQPNRLWKIENRNFDVVVLDGWSGQFDAWMMYKRGELSQSPLIKLNIPDKIQEILVELRKRTDDGSKWIAFALLDMSDDTLEAIAQAIESIKSDKPKPGMFRRFVYQEGDTVVSITASLNTPPPRLHDRTNLRTIIEKYRRKAVRSMGFGIMVLETSRPFEFAIWVEGPWEYDKELEELVEAEPPFLPGANQKLPGRNDPCICGNGKKFKDCCLKKIKINRKKFQEYNN